MNTISMSDLLDVMEQEIFIAGLRGETSKKTIRFSPANLKYKVRFVDHQGETSSSYTDPIKAIEKYNSYEV